jgi:methionyl-tRNA formyltransferase
VTGRPSGQARTLFIGSGPFGVPALQGLLAGGRDGHVEVVGVVTAPPRPAGRAGIARRTPIDLAAEAAGVLPVLAPRRLRDPAALADVLALQPDLVVLADYGGIVPAPLLEVTHGALNLHPSLLPRHRGASPIPATILAGDRETGVTIIRMDEGIDTGPIVAVDRVQLTGTESAPDLETRLATLGKDLLARTIGPWLRGELVAQPQPAAGVTWTALLRREDGRLDPGLGAAALERRIRAFQPWPGTFVETAAGRIVVHAGRVAPSEAGDAPGRVVAHGDTLALTTSDGRLVIDNGQPAGGRRMPGAELLRGRPGLVGLTVRDPRTRPA